MNITEVSVNVYVYIAVTFEIRLCFVNHVLGVFCVLCPSLQCRRHSSYKVIIAFMSRNTLSE